MDVQTVPWLRPRWGSRSWPCRWTRAWGSWWPPACPVKIFGIIIQKYLALLYKNIWHYYTKIFGMTTHLSTVLVQPTSTHVSKLSSANYGLNCNVAGILGYRDINKLLTWWELLMWKVEVEYYFNKFLAYYVPALYIPIMQTFLCSPGTFKRLKSKLSSKTCSKIPTDVHNGWKNSKRCILLW